MFRRIIVSDVVQGIIAGGVLAFITFQILAHAYVTKVNGWTTMVGCSEPGNGILLRGTCAGVFMGPINVPLRFGQACGMDTRHVPLRLLLATPCEQSLQKSDPPSRVWQRSHSGQYALYRAPITICRSPLHIATVWKLESDDGWRESRHAPYGRLA